LPANRLKKERTLAEDARTFLDPISIVWSVVEETVQNNRFTAIGFL
jgi:hypothetical protein